MWENINTDKCKECDKYISRLNLHLINSAHMRSDYYIQNDFKVFDCFRNVSFMSVTKLLSFVRIKK